MTWEPKLGNCSRPFEIPVVLLGLGWIWLGYLLVSSK
jgi:hypothetical protein